MNIVICILKIPWLANSSNEEVKQRVVNGKERNLQHPEMKTKILISLHKMSLPRN